MRLFRAASQFLIKRYPKQINNTNLYGTAAFSGSHGAGVVFEILP